MRDVLRILRNLKVHEVGGHSKMRAGCDMDGGYVMLDDFRGIARAYSLGIGGEISWDRTFADMGIPVEMYDDVATEAPAQHAFFDFHQARVDRELFANLAHGRDNVLKGDIEGAEWDILRGCDFRPFRQMVWELHGMGRLDTEEGRQEIGEALGAVNQTHVVVHVHANNLGGWKMICGNSIPLPDTLEVTWVRRKDYWIRASDEELPGPLDRPNSPAVAELYLGRLF